MLFSKQLPCVFAVNPMRLNNRLAVQQGLFLAPTTLEHTFDVCFRETGLPSADQLMLTLELEGGFLEDALLGLRSMGISQVALFQDLDGLARGLEDTIAIPHIYEAGRDHSATHPALNAYPFHG